MFCFICNNLYWQFTEVIALCMYLFYIKSKITATCIKRLYCEYVCIKSLTKYMKHSNDSKTVSARRVNTEKRCKCRFESPPLDKVPRRWLVQVRHMTATENRSQCCMTGHTYSTKTTDPSNRPLDNDKLWTCANYVNLVNALIYLRNEKSLNQWLISTTIIIDCHGLYWQVTTWLSKYKTKRSSFLLKTFSHEQWKTSKMGTE